MQRVLELGQPGPGEVAHPVDDQLGVVPALALDAFGERADPCLQRRELGRGRARAVARERLDPLAHGLERVLEGGEAGLQGPPGVLQRHRHLRRGAGVAVPGGREGPVDLVGDGVDPPADGVGEGAGQLVQPRPGGHRHLAEPSPEAVELGAHGAGLRPQRSQLGPYDADVRAQRPDQRRERRALVVRLVPGRGSDLLHASGQGVPVVGGAHFCSQARGERSVVAQSSQIGDLRAPSGGPVGRPGDARRRPARMSSCAGAVSDRRPGPSPRAPRPSASSRTRNRPCD